MPADSSAIFPAMFIADAQGIDFLNSIAGPVGVPVDCIRDGAGLVDWLRQAGLVLEHQVDEIAERAMPARWTVSPIEPAIFANGSGAS